MLLHKTLNLVYSFIPIPLIILNFCSIWQNKMALNVSKIILDMFSTCTSCNLMQMYFIIDFLYKIIKIMITSLFLSRTSMFHTFRELTKLVTPLTLNFVLLSSYKYHQWNRYLNGKCFNILLQPFNMKVSILNNDIQLCYPGWYIQ